jgi:hypothetical protein
MAKPNPGANGCATGCLGIIIVAIVFGVLITMCSGGGNGSSSNRQSTGSSNDASSHIPTIGDEYWFKIHPMCLNDYKSFDALADAEVKRDQEGAAQVLMEHGVDIGSGTHVRILNVDIFRSDVDVRVTSTDSDHYGEEIYCFIPPNSGGQPMFDSALQHI